MDETSQIDIPASFMALYLARPGARLRASHSHIAQRYALCEDMATMLIDTAQETLHRLGLAEQDVLQRCLQGLHSPPLVLEHQEARWVVRRLAELCNWQIDNLQIDNWPIDFDSADAL